ncbi:MAG: diguanylate cyclase [Chloroflexaceae bacterium]|nr:diguanylate cyclase [Chloroflexaceae bacterium]
MTTAEQSIVALQAENQRLQEQVASLQEQVASLTLERDDARAGYQWMRGVLIQSPTPIFLLRGEHMVYELANPAYLKMVQKTDVLGKSVCEVFPELEGQGYFETLEAIRSSGQELIQPEFPAWIDRDGSGRLEQGWFHLVYQPIRNVQGAIDGILHVVVEVTDQVRARQQAEQLNDALEQNRQLLQDIVDHSPSVIAVKDVHGQVLLANQAFATLAYLDPTGLMAQVGDDHRTVATVEQMSMLEQQVLNNDLPVRTEEQVQTGQTTLVYDTVRFPIRNEQGAIYAVGMIATDITQRWQYEETIRESERRLAETQRIAQLGSWAYDLHTHSLVWSDETFVVVGLPISDISPTIEEYMHTVHPEDRVRLEQTLEWALTEQQPYELELRHLRPDGSYNVTLTRGQPVFKDGQIVQFVGSVLDITERKQMEMQLRESEARYRMLVDYSLQGMLVFQDWRVVYANPAALHITGYTLEELLVMSAEEIDGLIYPDDLPMVLRYRGLRLSGEPAPARYEFRTIRKDGELRWLESFNVVIEYEQRMAVQMTYIDITERKQADERIKQMNAHLARSAADMERLTRMSSTLQRASSRAVMLEAVGPFLGELFSEQSGALYLISGPTGTFECVTTWGDESVLSALLPEHELQILFESKRDQPVLFTYDSCQRFCQRSDCSDHTPCCCVPIYAEDGPLGMLHISRLSSPSLAIYEQQMLLATVAADLIGLALANMQLREDLHHQSIHDPLTGLYNRRYLNEVLPYELERGHSHGQPVSLLLLDIDYFKRVNDTYGHQVGDAVLREVGVLLRQQTHGDALVGRYGGEEMILVLPDTSQEQALAYAEELRERLQQCTGSYRGQALPHFTVSIGVAESQHHGATAELLIAAADGALYKAKATGRNRVCRAE